VVTGTIAEILVVKPLKVADAMDKGEEE